MVTQIAPGVHWVGVVDWGLRQFHGHELSTHRGSSYNSYLIVDEKVVLVDTVLTSFQDQLIENIREVIDPTKIDYVIANHAEVDHSGSLPAIMRLATNATLVVSQRGRESVEGYYHQPWNYKTVKTGDSLSIGKNELLFIEAPMLHWPDSMFTYLTGKNILMSNDAFGQHYATAFRFNDQVNQVELYDEALKYYANILTPFSTMVAKKISEVLALGLPIDIIAPSHGVIWSQNPAQIITKYQEWSAQKPEKSAVIIYDTIWDGTRHMAESIGLGMADEGLQYKIFHAAVADRNDIIAEVFKAKPIVVGSCTFNQGVLPTITPVLEDLRGLKFQQKIGAAFGSYGWSGEGLAILEEHLNRCRIKMVVPGIKIKWQPKETELAQCRDLGKKIATVINEGGE
jgi:anaerobic nitric oxide reductase flavorubredoxin